MLLLANMLLLRAWMVALQGATVVFWFPWGGLCVPVIDMLLLYAFLVRSIGAMVV